MAASDFVLGDFSVDEHRPIRVVVIGAGIGGILAAIRSVAAHARFLGTNPTLSLVDSLRKYRTSS